MMQCYVNGIGVWSTLLADWSQASAVLRNEVALGTQKADIPMPAVLHAAERRRAPTTVKMALHVASAACAQAQVEPQLPCVFASSHGDTQISDYMCAELAQPQPALSPTRFHNSVHNAASGYWTIAVGSRHAANAMSAGKHSFAAGLLEAAALTLEAPHQALLVAYDMTAPDKLLPLCPIPDAFAVAMVISHQPSARSIARLQLSGAATTTNEPALPEALALLAAHNPAARSLPLLAALARHQTAVINFGDQQWQIDPC